MQAFEQLILLMGNMIAQIASEMVHIVSSGGYDDFADTDVWQSWRGDIVTTLLDAWSLILNDPLMAGSRHSHSGGGRSAVGQQLKAALQEITGNVYQHLLQCVLQITAAEVSAFRKTTGMIVRSTLTNTALSG